MDLRSRPVSNAWTQSSYVWTDINNLQQTDFDDIVRW